MLAGMRTRTSAADWAERVRAWRASGLSAEDFGGPLGYRPNALQWWERELSRRASPSKVRRRARSKPMVAMARVVRREAHVGAALEVRLGATVIAVRRGFDAQLLREVVSVLGGGGP